VLNAFLFVRRRRQGEFLRMRGHRFRLAEARMFRSVLDIAIWAYHGSHLRTNIAFSITPRPPEKQKTQNLDGLHRKNGRASREDPAEGDPPLTRSSPEIFNPYSHRCNHRLTSNR
jgi:hypothetical protein